MHGMHGMVWHAWHAWAGGGRGDAAGSAAWRGHVRLACRQAADSAAPAAPDSTLHATAAAAVSLPHTATSRSSALVAACTTPACWMSWAWALTRCNCSRTGSASSTAAPRGEARRGSWHACMQRTWLAAQHGAGACAAGCHVWRTPMDTACNAARHAVVILHAGACQCVRLSTTHTCWRIARTSGRRRSVSRRASRRLATCRHPARPQHRTSGTRSRRRCTRRSWQAACFTCDRGADQCCDR